MFGASWVFLPEHFEPLPAWRIPWIEEIPVFGRMLSGQTPLVYAGLALALVTSVVLYRMPFGLAVRSVGEQPDAARTAGIPPIRTKLAAVLISGLLCGLGGAHLA